MNCASVTVYDLPQSAASVIGATSANLDLPTGFSFALSKSAQALTDANKFELESVTAFAIPHTPINDAIFADFIHPQKIDKGDGVLRALAQQEGRPLRFDRVAVLGNTFEGWELELRRTQEHWADLATKTFIKDIDFGSYLISKPAIEGNWLTPAYEGDVTAPDFVTNPAVYFPLIDYGGWVDETLPPQGQEDLRVKVVGAEDFRPWYFLSYALKAGFCKFGWTIEGLIFEADAFRRLLVYDLIADYYKAGAKVEYGGRVRGSNTADYNFSDAQVNLSQIMRFDNTIYAQTAYTVPSFVVGGTMAAIRNPLELAINWRFKFIGRIQNTNAFDVILNFAIYELDNTGPNFPNFYLNGNVLTTPVQYTVPANSTQFVVFEQECIIQAGQRAVMNSRHSKVNGDDVLSGITIKKGSHIDIEPASKCLMTGDEIVVSQMVNRERTVMDLLKAAVHLIGGRIDENPDTKTIMLHPERLSDYFGDNVPGFILDEQPAVNLKNLVVVDSTKQAQTRTALKRYTRISFADSTDAYIDELPFVEPPQSRKIENSPDLPDEVEEIKNPLFEPTIEGQPKGLASYAMPLPYLPRLYDNTDGQRSFDIGPRILYNYGIVKQINPNPFRPGATPSDANPGFFFNEQANTAFTGFYTEFGYASMLPTWKLDPDSAVNLTFSAPGPDYFTIFHLAQLQRRKRGTLVEVLLWMRMRDYVSYNFRPLYKLEISGIDFVAPMTSIRDFLPCDNLPTPVQFYVEPADTQCCDRPCGCSFETCTYYQDFGEYLRQATLDSLQITSFKIDGIEQITDPVPFGPIELVDLDGHPYVMNLINALNSIGAPYFSFDISRKIHPTRGARFFTIKRPSCQPFEILISEGETIIYKYTQNEQLQSVFGSEQPFGYAPDFYDEPTDCVITNEY